MNHQIRRIINREKAKPNLFLEVSKLRAKIEKLKDNPNNLSLRQEFSSYYTRTLLEKTFAEIGIQNLQDLEKSKPPGQLLLFTLGIYRDLYKKRTPKELMDRYERSIKKDKDFGFRKYREKMPEHRVGTEKLFEIS